MKTKIILLLALALVGLNAWGQSICIDVISSGGNFENNASGSIAWTLGEVISETVTSASNIVTQGFHQTNCCIITSQLINEANDLAVYPNPATQEITIDFGKVSNDYFRLTLCDLHGRKLVKIKYNRESGNTIRKIDLSSYSAGTYLLNVQNSKTENNSSFRIIKIN